jgi:hypothetical protein
MRGRSASPLLEKFRLSITRFSAGLQGYESGFHHVWSYPLTKRNALQVSQNVSMVCVRL